MFTKIRGRRTTALATTLAVVVGLAIAPAFTATAAEGDLVEGAEPTAVVEAAAPVVEAVVPEVEPAEPAPPVPAVEEPVAEVAPESVQVSTPVVEAGRQHAQSPTAPLGARTASPAVDPEAAGGIPLAASAAIDFGIQPATIASVLAGERVEVEFTAPWWGVDRWQGIGLPPGLSLSKAGWLTGSVNSAGTYSFVVIGQTCHFGCWDLTSRIYTVTVTSPAPVVTTNNLSKATVGSAYSEQLSAKGVGTMTYRVSQGSLPAGLTLSTTGLISGTPVFASGYKGSDTISFSVIASNGSDSAAKPLSITVTTPGPDFGNAALGAATVGVPYSQALPLTTGYGTLTYTLHSGNLPRGLTLGSDGVITGTPEYAATYSATQIFDFTARVTGPTGFDNQPFKLTLNVTGPTITTATLPEAWLTKAYSQAIVTTGEGVALTATGLPAGLSLDGTRSTGYSISGTPTVAGAFSVAFSATNAGGTVTATIILTVNAAPVITTNSVPAATVGSAYSTLIKATGKNVTFTVSPAPGVQISASGELTWAPTGQRSLSVDVTATNDSGSHTKTFQLDSYAVPTIDATAFEFGIVGEAFAQRVNYSGRLVQVTVTDGTLPAGLTMRKTGTFAGTLTAPGTYSFEVTATNLAGSVSQWFDVTIYDAPTTSTNGLGNATVGNPYSDAVSFTGLDAQATLLSGVLPTGLTLNADGTITGTPTVEGSFRFTVEVTNPAGSVTRDLSIRSFQVPEITTTSVASAVTGVAYSNPLQANGDSVVFTVDGGTLPEGLALSSTGVLAGTAIESGTFTFTVRAANPAGADLQDFTIAVSTPAIQLSESSIIRGGSMTVSGSGFLPGDQVEIWLGSTLLDTATATTGAFTSTIVIPAGTAAGQHQLLVRGAGSGTHLMALTISLPAVIVPAAPVVPAAPAAPAAPAPTARQASPQASVQPQQSAVEPEEVSISSDSTQVDEVEVTVEEEVEAELETLDQPVAEGEKAAAPALDWTGLILGGFGLLLAALLVLFLLWRRRRAQER